MSRPAMIRLIYASTATFSPQPDAKGIEPNVARILMQSRRNNARARVGGVLHFGNGYFFQCLEGERDAVNEIYQRIGADPRHKDVQMLGMESIEQRMFNDWSMKYVAIEREVNAVLERHGLRAFAPYDFSATVIRDLLLACVKLDDPSRAEIPDAHPPAATEGKVPGFLRRLFSR